MSNLIQYDREEFIFGDSIEVDGIGKVRFLTYQEYIRNISYLSIIKMNVLHIYYQFRKMLEKKDPKAMGELEDLKKESLINIVRSQKTFIDSYVRIFELVLDENNINDSWSESLKDLVNKDIEIARKSSAIRNEIFTEPTVDQINHLLLMKALELIFTNEELFMAIRKLILDMQVLTEDEVSPHPMIQEGIEMSKMVKSQTGEKTTFTDILTSIVAGTSNSFEEVRGMNVYQVYSIFYRLGAMKNYDTETLFATVSSEVKISSWSKNIDLFENENNSTSSIKRSEFLEKTGELF